MKKRRIKEIKGLAQGHTGSKRQSQDLNSSSSSPESKFSTRCALSCMSVCRGRCICRLQWTLTESSNTHESLLSESKTNFTKLQWQRKVERFSPIDEFDEGSPTRFPCGQKETHYSFLSPPLCIDAWPELVLTKFTEWLLFQATESGGSGIEFMSQTAWVQILAWSLNSFTPLSLFPYL